MKRFLATALVTAALTALPFTARADETVGDKADSTARHATADVKKGARAAKDSVCMKGDAACAAQKAKHKVQNAGDDVKNTAKDTANKIN